MMLNLVRSEILKVRSTQVWLWMILPAVALTALATIGQSYSLAHDYHHGTGDLDYYGLFTSSQNGGVALLVIGVLGLTTEFRHKTITPTLLANPARWSLLTGKAISYAVFAVFYAILCVVVNFAIAIIWLQSSNVPLEISQHGIVPGVVKAFLSLVVIALFGLGLGALVRNQAAAMVIGIFYFSIIDGLLSVLPWERRVIYKFTPGANLTAFVSNGRHQGPDDVHLFAPLVGGLIFLAWTLAVLAAGGYFSLNRDIT